MLDVARAIIAVPFPASTIGEKETVAIGCPWNELKMITDRRTLANLKAGGFSQTLGNATDLVNVGRFTAATSKVALLFETKHGWWCSWRWSELIAFRALGHVYFPLARLWRCRRWCVRAHSTGPAFWRPRRWVGTGVTQFLRSYLALRGTEVVVTIL
jgi:hypothetical protein